MKDLNKAILFLCAGLNYVEGTKLVSKILAIYSQSDHNIFV